VWLAELSLTSLYSTIISIAIFILRRYPSKHYTSTGAACASLQQCGFTIAAIPPAA
jgi:hypothetical protein